MEPWPFGCWAACLLTPPLYVYGTFKHAPPVHLCCPDARADQTSATHQTQWAEESHVYRRLFINAHDRWGCFLTLCICEDVCPRGTHMQTCIDAYTIIYRSLRSPPLPPLTVIICTYSKLSGFVMPFRISFSSLERVSISSPPLFFEPQICCEKVTERKKVCMFLLI